MSKIETAPRRTAADLRRGRDELLAEQAEKKRQFQSAAHELAVVSDSEENRQALRDIRIELDLIEAQLEAINAAIVHADKVEGVAAIEAQIAGLAPKQREAIAIIDGVRGTFLAVAQAVASLKVAYDAHVEAQAASNRATNTLDSREFFTDDYDLDAVLEAMLWYATGRVERELKRSTVLELETSPNQEHHGLGAGSGGFSIDAPVAMFERWIDKAHGRVHDAIRKEERYLGERLEQARAKLGGD